MTLSKSQIDRLGERLKTDSLTEADRQLLDDYRSSMVEAYSTVTRKIREELRLQVTGRERKTTQSIIEKLRRQTSLHLSQMQDIAGCRVVVQNVVEQDNVARRIRALFEQSGPVKIFDRRASPSYGYRAVHVVMRVKGFPIEVQIRTEFQHHWADLSEKLADEYRDQNIKYGGGPEEVRELLTRLSAAVEAFEDYQRTLFDDAERITQRGASPVDDSTEQLLRSFITKVKEAGPKAVALRTVFESITKVLRARDESNKG